MSDPFSLPTIAYMDAPPADEPAPEPEPEGPILTAGQHPNPILKGYSNGTRQDELLEDTPGTNPAFGSITAEPLDEPFELLRLATNSANGGLFLDLFMGIEDGMSQGSITLTIEGVTYEGTDALSFSQVLDGWFQWAWVPETPLAFTLGAAYDFTVVTNG